MIEINKNRIAGEICSDIKHICKDFGSRNAGSEGEKMTAEYFYGDLSACADESAIEQFKINPSAFTGWIALSITCVLMGIVAYFFSSMVALTLLIIALIPFLFQYVLCKRMLDPLYAEKTSQNVTALKKCSEEPKKRLYLVANMDAGYENAIKRRLGGVAVIFIIVADLIAVLYFIALAIARWALVGGVGASIVDGVMLYTGLGGLAFVPVLFSTYFMISKKVMVDGANNNLTGCAVAQRAFKALADCGLKNTEVGIILTGGGASGLRGSKAWCDLHSEDVDRENTAFITLYTLRELSSLNVTSSELGGLVKSDKEICGLVLDSASELGLKCANRKIPFDASDSATFCERGFKSACICAINPKLPDYYVTRYDSYDNLSDECIAECYALTLEIARRFSGEEFEISNIDEADDAQSVIDEADKAQSVEDVAPAAEAEQIVAQDGESAAE